MIPEFPEFKTLEFSDLEEVKKFTSTHPPYSDFNFTSLWSWDVNQKRKISRIDDNLLVCFSDYLTDEVFYSFLGKLKNSETLQKIFDFLKSNGQREKLKLVPEDSIKSIDFIKFDVEPDRDNFDYILDSEKLAEYKGRSLRGHASFKRRFIEEYGDKISLRVIDIEDKDQQENLISLNKKWVENKLKEKKDVFPEIEYRAMKKFFAMPKHTEDFLGVGVFYEDRIIGFTIDELIIGEEYSLRHFMKADSSFKGVFSYLISEASKKLLILGKKYINIEQDLGLPNLRQSKKSFEPTIFLKKYTIGLYEGQNNV